MSDQSLAEFAAAKARQDRSFCSKLPPEIQEQIINTDCSAATCADWLRSIGYPEATQQKVDDWRRKRRSERTSEPQ